MNSNSLYIFELILLKTPPRGKSQNLVAEPYEILGVGVGVININPVNKNLQINSQFLTLRIKTH